LENFNPKDVLNFTSCDRLSQICLGVFLDNLEVEFCLTVRFTLAT
jgi:hypothetical protein